MSKLAGIIDRRSRIASDDPLCRSLAVDVPNFKNRNCGFDAPQIVFPLNHVMLIARCGTLIPSHLNLVLRVEELENGVRRLVLWTRNSLPLNSAKTTMVQMSFAIESFYENQFESRSIR